MSRGSEEWSLSLNKTPDLADEVAEVGSVLIETINIGSSSPRNPLYRKLKIALAHLVAEVKSIDVLLALRQMSVLQKTLEQVSLELEKLLCIDYVTTQYSYALEQNETLRSNHVSFISGLFAAEKQSPSPSEIISQWKRRPFPTIGMLCGLSQRYNTRQFDLKVLVKDDYHTLVRLIDLLKEWNRLVDQAYGGFDDDDNLPTDDRPDPPGIEAVFHRKDSARQLSTSLHNILHHNWPCQSESHDHNGRLGLCRAAKVYLDPQWTSIGRTNDGLFVLLTGPDILQQCRIYITDVGLEEDAPICLASHDDNSRSVCLFLTIDSNDQLWDKQTSAQPLEIIIDGEDYIIKRLSDLLMEVKPTYAAKRVMGIALSRCILHLLEGPWLTDITSTDDIHICCKLENDQSYPIFEKIFISTDFEARPQPQSRSGNYKIHPFPTIMALGIILMEIELGEDISEIKNNQIFFSKRHKPFYVARNLLDEVRKRFNLNSGLIRAAKFCTDRLSFSRFQSLGREALFSEQDFIDAYYNYIVRPLEEDLISGANWTWDQVEQLSLSQSGVCKVFTKGHAGGFEVIAETHQSKWQSPSRLTRPDMSTFGVHDNPTFLRPEDLADLSTTIPIRPKSREEFQVVIICALKTEANAVQSLFDEHWDIDGVYSFGRQRNDTNSYSVGVIGSHNVVLVRQPRMGKAAAASVAAGCLISFPKIKLALVVGVCGGVPKTSSNEEILLGDVIFSKGLVQYDFGGRYPDKFRQKSTVDDQLGRPGREIASLLGMLEITGSRSKLEDKVTAYLEKYEHETDNHGQKLYPGAAHDKLFDPEYSHKHHDTLHGCVSCAIEICDDAIDSTCAELRCDEQRLVIRSRQNRRNKPFLHFGLIASGDTILKSGLDRDNLAKGAKVIGFEMEGSGVWDTIPCVVIKGVCDYADSHKHKLWQDYAAMTAAASAKAFLRHWSPCN